MESPHKRRRISPSASPAISSPSLTASLESHASSSTSVKDDDSKDAPMSSIEEPSGIGMLNEDEVTKLSSGTSPSNVASPAPNPSSAVSLKSNDIQLDATDFTKPRLDDDDPLAEIDFSLLSHTPNVDTQTNLALFDPSSMVLDFSALDQSFLSDLTAELESALAASAENGRPGEAEVVKSSARTADAAGLDRLLGLESDATGFLGALASVGATPLGSPDLKALAESLVQDSPAISPKLHALETQHIVLESVETGKESTIHPKIEPDASPKSSSTIPPPLILKDTPAEKISSVKPSLSISPRPFIPPSGVVPNRMSTPVAAVVATQLAPSSSPKPKPKSSSPSPSVPLVSSTSTNNIISSMSTQPQLSLPSKQVSASRPIPSATMTTQSSTASQAMPIAKKPIMTKSNSTPMSMPAGTRPSMPTLVSEHSRTKPQPGMAVSLDDMSLDPNTLPPELMSFDFAALEASVLAGMAPSQPLSVSTATSTNTKPVGTTATVATTATPPPLANTQSLPTLPTISSTSSGTQSHSTLTSGSTHSSTTTVGSAPISRPINSQASRTTQPVSVRSQTAPVSTLRTMNPAAYGRPPAQIVNLNTVLTGINSLLASPSVGQASAFSTVNPDMSTPGSMWSIEDRKHYLSLLPSSSLVQIILKLTESHPGLLAYPRALSDVVLQLEVQALKPKSGPPGAVGVGHRINGTQSTVGTVGGQQQKYAVRPGVQAGGVQGRPALYHPPVVRPVGVRPGVRPVASGPRPVLASNGSSGVSVRPSATPLTPGARPRPINPIANSSIGRSPSPNVSSVHNHSPSIRPSGLPHTIPKLAALHTLSSPSTTGGAASVRPKGAGVSSPLSRPPGFHQVQSPAQGPGQAHGAAALHAAQAQAGMAALMSQLLPSRTPSPATGPAANGGKSMNGNGTLPKGST